MTVAVSFNDVNIVFGDDQKSALALMDQNQTREEIQSSTGQILGVHNCTFDVNEGEILVLMGLSGSGKSTLLRSVNGLNKVIRGSVKVNTGQGMVDVAVASAQQLKQIRRSRVAMVFQQFGLLPWRSVAENVGFGLEIAGMKVREKQERVAKQLELVGLSDWANRQVGELSGGMQQRVGLARAFATEAPILLMDEPFSALDPLIRTRLQDELLELQEKLKRTIIFVSHDLDEAFKLGDKIVIMEGGRVVQMGEPRAIFSNPINQYVADFVQHMNPLNVLTALDVMVPLSGPAPTDIIAADMPILKIMEQLDNSKTAVAVHEHGGAEIVGQITHQSLLDALKHSNS